MPSASYADIVYGGDLSENGEIYYGQIAELSLENITPGYELDYWSIYVDGAWRFLSDEEIVVLPVYGNIKVIAYIKIKDYLLTIEEVSGVETSPSGLSLIHI